MMKITVKVDGMMCGMCESHINDAVRRAFPEIKKVSSSRSKGETVILTETDLSDEKLQKVIGDTGYKVGPIIRGEEEAKKGFFSFLHK